MPWPNAIVMVLIGRHGIGMWGRPSSGSSTLTGRSMPSRSRKLRWALVKPKLPLGLETTQSTSRLVCTWLGATPVESTPIRGLHRCYWVQRGPHHAASVALPLSKRK